MSARLATAVTSTLREQLAARFGDSVRFDEPMSRHTSWRVGGPAEVLFQPRSLEVLSEFLAALPAGVPVHWVGLGSNLLVRDGGVPGVVVSSKKLPNDIERVDAHTVTATAGIPCTTLARQLVRVIEGGAVLTRSTPDTTPVLEGLQSQLNN